jgi:hypothetical protein
MTKLPCFDNLKELYIFLVGVIQLGVHDLICVAFSMQSGLKFIVAKCYCTSKLSNGGIRYG